MIDDTSSDLNERDWSTLVRSICRGHCILLLGPDIALDPYDPGSEPLTAILAKNLARDIAGYGHTFGDNDLPQIAQMCLQHGHSGPVRSGHTDLEYAVEDFYRPYSKQTSQFNLDLAALPFEICVTTSFDRFLINAFEQTSGKSPTHDYYDYRSGRVPNLTEPDVDHPLVYGLYGDVDDSQSLVITENDLLEFLVSIIKGQPKLPALLVERFKDPRTSFLFVGFGFYHWHLRILLHVLRAQQRRNRSIALEHERFFAHPERAETVFFFGQEHAIEFKRGTLAEFTSHLRQCCGKFAPQVPAATPASDSDAPTVFLCYSSSDVDRVMELETTLAGRGIHTWRDHKQLRGGDDWDRILRHVISKQVDYVVVLHSPHMVGRVESYVHIEIKAALDRQDRFSDNFRFVIPLLLEGADKLEKLSHLQYVDLGRPGGIDELIRAIRDDWQARQMRVPRRGNAG